MYIYGFSLLKTMKIIELDYGIQAYIWKCVKCGKVIKSFYTREIEQNVKVHNIKCNVER